MPDRAAVVAALTAYVNTPVGAPAELRADPADVFGGPPLTTLSQVAQTLDSRAELDALLAEVAPLIRAADPYRGSVIAIGCGTLVEMGGDPALVAPHLMAALPRHLTLARRMRERMGRKPDDDDALFADDPDGLKAATGLTYLLLAAMAVLCRGAAFRQAARADAEVVAGVAALRDSHREAAFVAQVLDYTDGVELLVLAPQEGKGFRVALEAVATNFHLFTLLQAALVGGGHLAGDPPDPEVVAVATGAAPHQRALPDRATLHFYTWDGLRPDGSLAAANSDTWIPGDGRPTDLPLFAGARIMVVGPPLPGSRLWDSDSFANIHDALTSRAEVVEVLPPDQVAAWLDRIRQAQR